MQKLMLAATIALAFGWIGPSLASPGPANATSASGSSLAGLIVEYHSPERGSSHSPPT